MADALISVLLERLVSITYEYVEGELKHDAEQRQVTDQAVKIWLDELKDISYQMVDVLDEWNTDILKQQVEKQEVIQMLLLQRRSRVFLRRDIALKIKDLNDELTKINKEREDYQFLSKELGIQQHLNDLKLHLLSIYLRYLGWEAWVKTTLTQIAYNDDHVKAHFEIRKWVCVSDPFDEIKIAKDISGDCATSSNQLDYVLQRMSESIQGKRFLLVLDDVWTENRQKWELLKVPLMQNGAKGSIILVTTRKKRLLI
ncbi:unnamed protein product [Prunus armeniaca]|uniref:Rx N-terminal domain-containing protein n=1 Tax=Prunus armeniaca TaxID=36596 RepID=A0A6J5W8J0_PRUAR|nr:unnamed protein product [Prunus armeniaca]